LFLFISRRELIYLSPNGELNYFQPISIDIISLREYKLMYLKGLNELLCRTQFVLIIGKYCL